MTTPTRLQGLELIDCARANAKQGSAVTAQLCGYQTDVLSFQQQLQQACQQIGVEISELSDLIAERAAISLEHGVEVAPETAFDL